MKTIVTLSVVSLMLAACAKAPDAIPPVYPQDVIAMPCNRLTGELINEQHILQELSEKQRKAANGDTLGVLLFGLPVSSMIGEDVSGELAASKGRMMQLESQYKACSK